MSIENPRLLQYREEITRRHHGDVPQQESDESDVAYGAFLFFWEKWYFDKKSIAETRVIFGEGSSTWDTWSSPTRGPGGGWLYRVKKWRDEREAAEEQEYQEELRRTMRLHARDVVAKEWELRNKLHEKLDELLSMPVVSQEVVQQDEQGRPVKIEIKGLGSHLKAVADTFKTLNGLERLHANLIQEKKAIEATIQPAEPVRIEELLAKVSKLKG